MTKAQQITSVFLLTLAVVLMLAALVIQKAAPAEASVNRFAEYQATSTRGFNGTAMQNLQNVTATTTATPGTLGSVVIEGAAAGVINFYDATTTSVLLRAASMSTTSIFLGSFPASAAAGTYTFDVLFTNGLIVETIGTTPTSTITYRLN